jgi:hypothetical protein
MLLAFALLAFLFLGDSVSRFMTDKTGVTEKTFCSNIDITGICEIFAPKTAEILAGVKPYFTFAKNKGKDAFLYACGSKVTVNSTHM